MKYFQFIFILSISINLSSQDFVNDLSEWHYRYFNTGNSGCVKLLFETDTIIEGHTYKQFYKHYETRSSLTGLEFVGKNNPEYIRTEGDRVYVWLDWHRKFTLLFDFGTEVGDQWEIDLPKWGLNGDKIRCTVLETGLDTINDQVLDWLRVEYYINDVYNYEDKIYAKFGSVDYALFPWDEMYGQTDGHELGNLGKYTDGNFEYITHWLPSCEQSTSTIDKNEVEPLTIFPNPASDILEIKHLDKFDNLKFFNQKGEQVKCNIIYNQIDVSTFEGGVYFVFVSNEKSIRVLKFIKQ